MLVQERQKSECENSTKYEVEQSFKLGERKWKNESPVVFFINMGNKIKYLRFILPDYAWVRNILFYQTQNTMRMHPRVDSNVWLETVEL